VSALATLAQRIGRHGVIYGVGTVGALVFGLVQVSVLTRLLDVPEFGQLSVLLVFSALLTLVYNMGTLQGSMARVFGAAADDGGEDGDDLLADEPAEGLARDKRRALGTAIAVTAFLSGLGTVGLALAAPAVAELLLNDRAAAGAVVWMAVSAALGAVWRLVSNVLRMERRPTSFGLVNTARPVCVVAVAVPLVAIGGGVEDAMAGVALGTALSLGIGLVVTRGSYSFRLNRKEAAAIFQKGWSYIPVVLSMWMITHADVLLLSRYVPDADVALYRVASRIAALLSYVVSAFFMAWGPLSRTPLHAAVEKERGWTSAGATVTTYFTLAMIGLVLGLAISADLLVQIAPPSYAGAASLIPLIGLGIAVSGLFVVIYRVAKFRRKRPAYIALRVVAAVVFLVSALVLMPALGGNGAALSVIVGSTAGLVGMVALSQRGSSPLPLEYGRLAAGAGLALACLVVAKGAKIAGGAVWPVEVAALLAFPVLLVALRVIPREHVAALREMARALKPERTSTRQLRSRLAALDDRSYSVLRGLIYERRDLGSSGEALRSQFVAALREVGELGEPADTDARVAPYLLFRGPVAEHDELGRRLWSEGVDPLELDALALTFERLTGLGRAAWEREATSPASWQPEQAPRAGARAG
jgi:O-antigen/teichoic acid export membrane protein